MSKTTQIHTTAVRPSDVAMPTSAFLAAAMSGARIEATGGMATDAVRTAPTYVARERFVAGDAVVKGAFPGTTAWSPPTS
jgi:hypothetical protein